MSALQQGYLQFAVNLAAGKIPKFGQFLSDVESLLRREIEIRSLQEHPEPPKVQTLLASAEIHERKLIVYLSQETIAKSVVSYPPPTSPPPCPRLVASLVTHELLHLVLDGEGYPQIVNLPPYVGSSHHHSVAGAIQNAVNHIEIYKRHAESTIYMLESKPPVESLLETLRQQAVTFDELKIQALFAEKTRLSAMDAISMMQSLIETLGYKAAIKAVPIQI